MQGQRLLSSASPLRPAPRHAGPRGYGSLEARVLHELRAHPPCTPTMSRYGEPMFLVSRLPAAHGISPHPPFRRKGLRRASSANKPPRRLNLRGTISSYTRDFRNTSSIKKLQSTGKKLAPKVQFIRCSLEARSSSFPECLCLPGWSIGAQGWGP